MSRLGNFIATMWRPFLGTLVFVVLLFGLLSYKLSSVNPGPSLSEHQLISDSRSLENVSKNLVNSPYKLAHLGSSKISNSFFAKRLISVVMGVLIILFFYNLSKRFLNSYSSFLITILLSSSTLFLFISRSATPQIMLLLPIVLATIGYWLRFRDKKSWVWLLACIFAAISVFIPGMIFLLLAISLWQRRTLLEQFKAIRRSYLIIGFLPFVISISLIALNIISEPTLWRQYLGLSSTLSLAQFGNTLWRIPASLFVYTPANPYYWLGHQAVFDVFSSLMFLLGSYSLYRKRALDRSRLLAGWLLLGTMWVALTGDLSNMILILPAAYIVSGFGIYFLIRRWNKIFPNNPLARSVGSILMCIAVLSAASFQLVRYFVAWPNNPDTIKAYNQSANLLQYKR